MGKVSKGINCSAANCSNEAERSISKINMKTGSLTLNSESKRVYLCKSHYRDWKKSTKNDRNIERARFT